MYLWLKKQNPPTPLHRPVFWYMSATFHGLTSLAEAVIAAVIIWEVKQTRRRESHKIAIKRKTPAKEQVRGRLKQLGK